MSTVAQIDQVLAREILDSRGKPTVEVEVRAGKFSGRASVPSGASTGLHEACELRDKDDLHYEGLGVRRACQNVREILGPAIIRMVPGDQRGIDEVLLQQDRTRNKSRLGANAILGVSLAVAHTAAAVQGIRLDQQLHMAWCQEWAAQGQQTMPFPSLPLPMVNMISGGLHAGGQLEFQDFLIIPHGAKRYSEALEWIVRIYRRLGELLQKRGYEGVLVGDEGGYGPRLPDVESAAECVVAAIEAAKLRPGEDVSLALDVASTHFYEHGDEGGSYQLLHPQPRRLRSAEMVDFLVELTDRFPIISIEDGLAEDDWAGWKLLTDRLGDRVQLVGDDLFVTNVKRLEQGIAQGVANSVLIKVNQIGTLTETFRTLIRARQAGYAPVVSARSGETEDATLADLAVATGAGQIKIGSVARSERLAKYNQLLRLEEVLGPETPFSQGNPLFRR